MSTIICEPTPQTASKERQVVVFHIGEIMAGIDIDCIQEINGNLAITPTPIAPSHVRGVANLRGEVMTVLDLRQILEMESAEITPESANIVVQTGGEQVGFLVDRVEDVLTLRDADAQPPTSNVDSLSAELFESVYQLEEELLVVLNVEETVARS